MKAAVILVFLSGCYADVGPVVRSVHLVDGHLYYTRCELSAGPVGAKLTGCVDETGQPRGPQ
jgi:hypothetical protein